jgi:hypothetical protein
VIPDAITAKVTRKVTSGIPKARLTNSAAPPARGYFVISSA